MKKILIFAIIFVICLNISIADTTIQIASDTTPFCGYSIGELNSGGQYNICQAFYNTTISDLHLKYVRFMLGSTTTSTPNNLLLRLREYTRTGTVLAFQQLPLGAGGLNTSGNAGINYAYFDYTITAGKQYYLCLEMETANISGVTRLYDGCASPTSNPYEDGNFSGLDNDAPYTVTTRDMIFQLTFNATGGGGTTPSVTLATSIINNSKNGFLKWSDGIYRFGVNATSVNNSNNYTLQIYTNGGLNQQFNNINLSSNLQYSYNFSGSNSPINFTINTFNENASANLTYAIYVDGINPELLVVGIINNSMYYKNISAVIRFNATASDNNLYALNVTIVNATNSRVFGNLSESLTTNSFTQVYALNYSNMSLGRYTLIIEAWDSHTATKINDFDAKKDLTAKKLTFDKITISTPENIKDLDYTKEKDRYSFAFDFKDKKAEYSVIIESTGALEYLKTSQYKGHFVDFQANKWVDFEGDHDISISKLANNKYEVKVKPRASKSDNLFRFKSIGDLNYIATSYNFNITLPSVILAKDANTLTSINEFRVKIFNSTFSQEETTTNGLIYSNVTNGAYNLTYSGAGYVNQTYNNILLGQALNHTGFLNATGAFTVYIKDELTLSLINQLVTLEFIPQTANASKNYTTSSGVKYISDLSEGEYIIRYSSTNYSNAFYYFTLENSTSSTFTIYMLPQESTSNVTAYVYDEVANAVSDAFIHVQKYDLNTNSYITVEIVKTNFEGRAIVHVIKNSEFYKFLIYYNGELELNTDASYIYDDTIAFQIYLGEQFANDFFEAYGVNYQLTYNPTSNNVAFTYSDNTNSITNGTLKLFNATSGALYNISSVSSTSATILLLARNTSGAQYDARAYVKLNNKEYYLTSLRVEYPVEANIIKEDGSALFYIFLLTVVFIFIGFFDLTIAIILTPIPLVISSIIGLIALSPLITIPMQILALIIAYLININKG
jgi:hypothetical protein